MTNDSALLDIVIPVAIALSVEQDFNRLLERILLESKTLCRADAGTLYVVAGSGELVLEWPFGSVSVDQMTSDLQRLLHEEA